MMEKIGRLEIAKIVVTPAIALIVAIIGWVLTEKYNSTQRDVAEKRAEADIEIARVNAAMRYMEFVGDIPETKSVQHRRAISIAAPVLPPDLAFRLAIEQLPDDPLTLDVLMRKFGNGAFAYLARYLEVPLGELKQTLRPELQQTKSETRAFTLLVYLRRKSQSQHVLGHLISDEYTNDSLRPITLLLYFFEYRASLIGNRDKVSLEDSQRKRIKEELQRYLRMPSLSARAKQAIAFAGSVAFGLEVGHECDFFFQEATSRFWDNLDVTRGATPEGSFQGYLYAHVFDKADCRRDAIARTSASLRDKILRLNVGQLRTDNVQLLLHYYAVAPTVASNPAYLVPADVVEVMRFILSWANTRDRRQELSVMLGSLSGHLLFRNMLPSRQSTHVSGQTEEALAECEAARAFAEMLLDWYERHHSPDWFIPKFFDDVVNEFPDLENRVNREAWD